MPEIITNVPVSDEYSIAAMVGPALGVEQLSFIVSGNPVFAQFFKTQGGDEFSGPILEQIERFFLAGSIVSASKICGVQFRNANPGQAATVSAEIAFVNDPLIEYQGTGIASTNLLGVITRTIFDVPGSFSYNPPAGCVAILVECIGGGGGGGGIIVGTNGQVAVAGGGGGGGYSSRLIQNPKPDVVGVGIGGAGGASGGFNGSVGGKTQYSTNGSDVEVTAFPGQGGTGGSTTPAPTSTPGGVGGAAAGGIGDFCADGSSGSLGIALTAGVAGNGGAGGAAGAYSGAAGYAVSLATPGGTGLQFGGGGSGAVRTSSTGGAAGGNGAGGLMVITEFY